DAEDLLRVGCLGERGEATEVAEEGGDLASMSSQELLALVAGEQVGRLRGESSELGPLTLDRLEQADVFNCDHDVVGERFEQPDVGVVEGPNLDAPDGDDTDRLAFTEHRDADG